MEELAPLLSLYDLVDLASKVAALQLVPQNASHLLRLHFLAECIARRSPEQPGKFISRGQLRKLCNQSPLARSFSAQEDPSEDLFTANITFIGGSYVVFPGLVTDGVEIIRLLSRAIFLHPEPFPDPVFVSEARKLIRSVLVLSNAVATRAGLSRWQEPNDDARSVIVPPQERLDHLAEAVSFDDTDFADLLMNAGLSPTILDAVTQRMGDADEPIDDENLGIFAKPILGVSGKRIVLAPGELLSALRHRILCLSHERGVASELSRRFRQLAWHDAREILSLFGNTFIGEPPGRPTDVPFIDGLFRLDFDKSLYVQLVSDDFSNYNYQKVYGEWNAPDLVTTLENRQRQVEEDLFGSNGKGNPNANLVLILLQSIGRLVVMGIGKPLEPFLSPRLLVNLTDMESISEVEHGDPLLLWNFAQASDRIRDQAQIIQFSMLDEFAMYRAKEYSFYFSDKRRPDLISIAPGTGAKLRFQGKKERDYHAISSTDPNHIIEVTSFYGDPAIPIYAALSQIGTRTASAVENLPVLVWVTSPTFDNDETLKLRPIYLLLSETIAYWLWQFTPSITSLLGALEGRFEKLFVFVELQPSPEWTKETSTRGLPFENDMDLRHDASVPSLTTVFRAPFIRRLASPDNSGERYLMRQVIQELRALMIDIGVSPEQLPIDEEIDLMIDRHAPLGLKKKCIVIGSSLNPVLDGQDLPDFRPISKPEINVLLDELGDYLRSEYGLPEGAIPDAKRVEVLETVVAFYFRNLEQLVSTLHPNEALPFLIARQETNTHESADRRLKIPTRLACFGTEPEMIEMLSKEIPEVNAANQCARFIIEYLAARPPSGLRPMSLSVYDRLLSLADEIIGRAYERDLIHFGIADLKLNILPSGRLGVERATYMVAQDQFLDKMSLSEIIRAPGRMPGYWREPETSQSSPPQGFDQAFQAEFGYSLFDFTTVIGEIFNIGAEQEGPVKSIEELSLVEQLVNRTNFVEDKIRRIVNNLVLVHRESFFRPPDGFEDHDVYPWRFTRPLSYMRRPLIATTQASRTLIVWGNRHLYESGRYLISIILSGRLQPRTLELKQFIADINREESFAFNDRVAEAFEQFGDLKVGRRVKKIGKKRIQGAGGDLGDIDVLVISTKRKWVLVIECKDFEVARNPREFAHELASLFVGSGRHPSTVAKHQRRSDWVKQNLTDVLDHYQIQRNSQWRVNSLVVVSEESFSPHLFPTDIPVISYETLVRDFIPKWQ